MYPQYVQRAGHMFYLPVNNFCEVSWISNYDINLALCDLDLNIHVQLSICNEDIYNNRN